MTIANWFFGLLFLTAALLQWNDPDPWRWFLVYAAAGVVSIIASYRPAVWVAALIIAVAGVCWAAVLIPEVARGFEFRNLFSSMKAENPNIEASREFLGLMIIVGWMAVVITYCRRRLSNS